MSRLEAWLNDAIHDEEKEGACSAVSIVHMTGETPYEVDLIRLPHEKFDAQSIARRFEGKINAYCKEMPGRQECWVYAFYGKLGDDRQDPGARMHCPINGKVQYPQGATEAPTAQGLLQQGMREREAHLGLYIGAQKSLLEGFAQLANAQRMAHESVLAENARLRAENNDAYTLLREAANRENEQVIDRSMAVLKAQKEAMFVAKLMEWAPAIANTIMQKKVFPESVEDSAIVKGLLDNMTKEHIAIFQSLLPPQIAGLVSARMEELIKRKEHERLEGAEARQLQSGVTPESELQ